MSFKDRVQQYRRSRAYQDQESAIKSGSIAAGPLGSPSSTGEVVNYPIQKTVRPLSEQFAPIAFSAKNAVTNAVNGVKSFFPSGVVPAEKISGFKPTPTPTYLMPKRTPTPEQYPIYSPRVPQNIPQTYYTGRNMQIEPSLYDAIHGANATTPEKEMLFSLGSQESGGGYTTEGDSGKSHGPYHISEIYRKNITPDQARDPVYATSYVLNEMRRNMSKGIPLATSLKSWNSKSGYVNNGPKYDSDIPQMATTSSFRRGKK